MIKALFFDLDGTLLNSQKKISPETKSTLLKCKQNGIKLFIATARPPILDKMLNWTKDELSLFDGGIYCNGACRKLFDSTEYQFVPSDVVSYCIHETAKYNNLNIALQLKNELHAFNNPLDDFAYNTWGIHKDNTAKITEKHKFQTVKILIYYENIIDSITPIPKLLSGNLKQYCSSLAKFYLADNGKVIQITNRQSSKFTAIEIIRKNQV